MIAFLVCLYHPLDVPPLLAYFSHEGDVAYGLQHLISGVCTCEVKEHHLLFCIVGLFILVKAALSVNLTTITWSLGHEAPHHIWIWSHLNLDIFGVGVSHLCASVVLKGMKSCPTFSLNPGSIGNMGHAEPCVVIDSVSSQLPAPQYHLTGSCDCISSMTNLHPHWLHFFGSVNLGFFVIFAATTDVNGTCSIRCTTADSSHDIISYSSSIAQCISWNWGQDDDVLSW